MAEAKEVVKEGWKHLQLLGYKIFYYFIIIEFLFLFGD